MRWGGIYTDFKVRIIKLVHPDKGKKLHRGRAHVNNGETNHLLSKLGHELSGTVAFSMIVCDSNIGSLRNSVVLVIMCRVDPTRCQKGNNNSCIKLNPNLDRELGGKYNAMENSLELNIKVGARLEAELEGREEPACESWISPLSATAMRYPSNKPSVFCFT